MEKHFQKLLSITLVLAMVCTMIPAGVFALEQPENLSADAEAVLIPQANEDPAEVITEVTEKRTQYSKEFLLSNGLHMATVYADPVHYEKDGKWVEIDNTLKTAKNGTVTNTAGVWNVSFPQQFSEGNVTIEKDGYTLSFTMDGELRSSGELQTASIATEAAEELSLGQLQTTPAVITPADTAAIRDSYEYEEAAPETLYSQLRYDNVYQGTDIVYDLQGNTVKESIVMDSYSSTLRGYRYTLNAGQLIPVLEEDGQITFYGSDQKEIVMIMPAPYLLDANSAFCDDIQVQLSGNNGTYTLTYLLPSQWLAAGERAWPVILDPVVQADVDADNILDRTVCENKTHSYTWSILDAGYSAERGKIRSYLRYEDLPPITSSDVVVAAQLRMYKVVTSPASQAVELHKVTQPWNSQTVTWGDKPDFSEKVEDYQDVKNEGNYFWNITDMVRDWYATENYGMVIKLSDAVETGGVDAYRQFYSSDAGSSYRPHLTILFRNNNGLESYWDYTSSSAGRAGNGYVNHFTGNLTWVRNDMGFGGNLMPVSISHVYNANDAITLGDDTNSNDSGGNSFGMGIGWRTNYNQLVYQWSEDSTYYVWEDADGTDHYFKKISSGKYQDEDGLELTLTTTGTNAEKYKITDKAGNTHVFDKYGRLVKLANNQAASSSIAISYTNTTGKKIQKITDGAGRKYYFDYNSNGLLASIRYTGKNEETLTSVTYGYTGELLNNVTDRDGKTAFYTYNDAGLLTSAQDIDGYRLNYCYNTPVDTWQPYRVIRVSEEDRKHGAAGGVLNFTYGYNRTTLKDHNENKVIYQFNDWGTTVAIQDDEGHASYAQYARTVSTDTTGKANQLRLSSKIQNTVGNLVRYGGFETGSDWRKISSSSNSASSAVSRTTEQSHTGSYSLKLSVAAASASNAAYCPDFTLQPGETVTCSFYVLMTQNTGTAKLYRRISGGASYIQSIPLSSSDQWQRVQMTYTNETGEVAYMRICFFAREVGAYYIDSVQAEKSSGASRYNLVENGDFRYEGGWAAQNLTASDVRTTAASAAPQLDGTVYRLTGDAATGKEISQQLALAGSANDTYVLSGWAKGESVSLIDQRQFGLKATFHNADGTTTERTVSFSADTQGDWQYAATPVVAEKDYTAITVSAVYAKNLNTVCFDGIQLYKEEFGSSYTYDEDGNLISVVDLQKKTTTYEYDDETNDLLQIIEDNVAKVTYTYDSCHNVTSAVTEEGLTYGFWYDAYGNNTKVTIGSGETTISSQAVYTEDKNYLLSSIDALGETTYYGYHTDTGTLEWVQYPGDTEATRTEYTYDDMYRTASAVCETDTALALSTHYTYTDDYLTAIRTPSTTYTFTYGVFGQRESVQIGDTALASYAYTADRNRYLQQLTYGNDDYVRYTYDDKGRLLTQTYEDGDSVTYTYDNDGALATVTDSATGRTTAYYYDFTDRLMKYEESGSGFAHSLSYEYDLHNNLSRVTETVNGSTRITSYTYDEDNRVTSVTADGTTVEYTYDTFGRLTQQVTKAGETVILTEEFTYTGDTTAKTTSSQIATYTTTAGTNSVTYSYTYDENGNILTVSDGTHTTSYAYDSANQLIRENNEAENYTHTWVYDNAGNILERKEYGYTTAEQLGTPAVPAVEYTYGSETWGDLLTGYGTDTVTYDDIGNPETFGSRTYTWEHGRQLQSLTEGETTWQYQYNSDGLRTRRTDESTTYNYIYHGSQLTQMTAGSNTLRFAYDASGVPLTVTYNGTKYYYAVNLQGDITGILDSNGNTVASYSYDAWGNCLTSPASGIGLHNPLRYRGYVYDSETQLYYLQSRYYDPETGRFLNADAFATTGQGFTGNNMFAYCGNNPVNNIDPAGQSWRDIWEFIKEAFSETGKAIANMASAYTGCGAVAAADGPLPFGDFIGVVGGALITVGAIGYGIYEAAQGSQAKSVSEAIAEAEKTPPQTPTVIYRYHASKTENLSPRPNKDYDGLSFSTTPPKPGTSAVVTTIEAVNATGILTAIPTGGPHITVIPTNGTVMQWMDQGMSSIWSQTLSWIVAEWDGDF